MRENFCPGSEAMSNIVALVHPDSAAYRGRPLVLNTIGLPMHRDYINSGAYFIWLLYKINITDLSLAQYSKFENVKMRQCENEGFDENNNLLDKELTGFKITGN